MEGVDKTLGGGLGGGELGIVIAPPGHGKSHCPNQYWRRCGIGRIQCCPLHYGNARETSERNDMTTGCYKRHTVSS